MRAADMDLLFPEASDQYKAPESDPLYLDVSTKDLAEVLVDPENRVEPEFKVPAGLEGHVAFWLKIYARYSSMQTVVFDKESPDKIYAVQDAREFMARGMGAIGIEIMSKRRLQSMLDALRHDLGILARNPKAQFKVGAPGSRALQLWGRCKASHWRRTLANIKTQKGQRDYIYRGIRASRPFMKPMEDIFREAGLPVQLSRLPLLESSFQITAESKASAVGVWQFLVKSAQEYMIVDERAGIDERLSPIKSAHAATRMFKRNMRILGDIALSVIAYNHGARNLVKIRHQYGVKNIAKLLDARNKQSPLGYASRNYFAEFLAIVHAEVYQDRLYHMPASSSSYRVQIVKLTAPQSVFEVAAFHQAPLDAVKTFNPDIFDLKRRLPKGTRVVIPFAIREISAR